MQNTLEQNNTKVQGKPAAENELSFAGIDADFMQQAGLFIYHDNTATYSLDTKYYIEGTLTQFLTRKGIVAELEYNESNSRSCVVSIAVNSADESIIRKLESKLMFGEAAKVNGTGGDY